MSMQSKVGNPQIYNDGDQRTAVGSMNEAPPRFEAGQENSHSVLDSKDERTIANKVSSAEKAGKEEKQRAKQFSADPTKPARDQGHEPSKGAKIDKELQDEEQAELRKKGRV